MSKIAEIMEKLETLTLLEAAELVEKIEETFGVDASAGGGMVMMPGVAGGGDAGAEAVEEKTEFDLLLAEVPADKKIAILKVVRGITGLGLKEAKEVVDNVPKVLKEAATKEESENIKKELEASGAGVDIK